MDSGLFDVAGEGYRPSAADSVRILGLIETLESVATEDDFKDCMDGDMQGVFAHGMLVCGIARTAADAGGVQARYLMLHRFPAEYLESLRQPNGQIKSALIERWRITKRPVLVELEHDASGWPEEWLRNLQPYDFRNFASHSLFDSEGVCVSNFCFAQLPGRLGPRHAYLLRLLVPHLHVALQRVAGLGSARPASGVELPRRQKEILHWMQIGKTNWEIATILGTSSDNVKYHVKQLLLKLNAANRAHAVARALELNLLGE